MNTSKHTPGPWHIGMKPGPMVYGPQGEQVVPINVMLDMSEVTANANLIAAAPVMYEALKDALACVEQTLTRKEINERRDKINSALAQAEGR